MKRQIFAVVAVVLLVKTIGVVHAQSVNLFANPSVETVSLTDTTKPASWGTGKWGNHTRVFSYPVAGYDGSKAVRILVTAYTDGDAKWFPNDVAVTPNTTYTFTHAYQSDVTTSIDIRYTSTEGVVTYVLLAPSVPASSAWKTDSYTFKTPANVASMTVMHIIESNGTLTTDMYSLSTSAGTVDPSPTPAPVPSPTPVPTTGNLILNPSFESRTTTGDVLPLNWAKSIWGTGRSGRG